MLVSDSKITMSAQEFEQFQAATFASWVPRTIDEFDAMCMLGSARHQVENLGGEGFIDAMAAEAMMFGENGEVNFPLDRGRAEYMRVHGSWPTDAEYAAFTAAGGAAKKPGLKLVES
jgi:hypothetical protein